MGKLLEKFQAMFAASSFAEAGEVDMAMEIAGISQRKTSALSWGETFAAAAFAEANCHDIAREITGAPRATRNERTLDAFLDSVGLSGVRVCYGMARI
jgi:hypothetical protein